VPWWEKGVANHWETPTGNLVSKVEDRSVSRAVSSSAVAGNDLPKALWNMSVLIIQGASKRALQLEVTCLETF
jgi:hypothetical protein